tara:strand:+ start:2106 stop:3869 length:1764 start_codon:yes stop_codon:yes gene_type:complete
MIKELAFGVNNRHHFVEEEKVSDWMNMNKDTFVSLWDYDEYVIEYVKKKQSLSGYDGLLYMPNELILDVDGSNPDNARQKTIGLTILLKDLEVPFNLYFSGTGFHVGIPSKAFRWKPDKNLHSKVKNALKIAGIYDYADPSVTDKTRIIRLVNTMNGKSNKWKVHIPNDMIHKNIDYIIEYASKPQEIKTIELECEPVFDVLVKHSKEENTSAAVSLGRAPDSVNYPCVQSMMEGTVYGNRHAYALRIASHLRWRYPEEIVIQVMEYWRSKVDSLAKPFKKDEMESIINSCYEGHDGAGYRYGCEDPVKDKLCKNTCVLYKAKKSQSVMTANDMDKVMADFYTTDQRPLDLGAVYGQKFPIYPGEVVIIQAPPKSMKTMLLQNWVNHFKKPTYFMEMEMSPRQIWSRFVMIERGWKEDEIAEHYKSMRNGITKDFSWLTVDYGSCYPTELQKRISMLPVKPEIVVVDHMGLLRSQQRDNNMKVEEASQGLMELAVQNNIIVFAVSEITKQAFHEGMNMASAKGSFRVAYNANKLISVNPIKNNDGQIAQLHVKSEANRERETLDVKLWVEDVRITGTEVAAYEQVVS